ncbi:MAG: TraR/DksA C4-type zinc finger protein [Panacagrimonas sp.]
MSDRFDAAYLTERLQHLQKRREEKRAILETDSARAGGHSLHEVTRIDFAIRRIKEGQYGLCCNCGRFIEEERLADIPEALLCSFCLMRNNH